MLFIANLRFRQQRDLCVNLVGLNLDLYMISRQERVI